MSRFARFAMVGSSSYLLNAGVLFVATEWFGQHYVVSTFISLGIVTLYSYVLNRVFSFKSTGRPRTELPRYILVTIGSFLSALLLMSILIEVASMHYLLANALVAVLMLILNFLLSRHIVFVEHRSRMPQEASLIGSQRHT